MTDETLKGITNTGDAGKGSAGVHDLQSRGKSLIQSKSFWGAVVALASFLIQLSGGDAISPAGREKYVEYILSVVEALGILYAIYGRYAAEYAITGFLSPKRS